MNATLKHCSPANLLRNTLCTQTESDMIYDGGGEKRVPVQVPGIIHSSFFIISIVFGTINLLISV